jgi:protein-S-isoprenylcysteine O-methyltransferase Ste14
MQSDKVIDIALSAVALYTSVKGTTAPFTAAQEERGKASNDWIRKLGITRISTVYHIALLAVTAWQSYRILQLDNAAVAVWQNSGDRIMFRLMTVANIMGGSLRVLCFRTLGRFFTFDLAVQTGQKVIQSGPYAYVRHPSYSAMLLHQAGFSFSLVYSPLIPLHWRQRAAWINVALTLFAAVSTTS